MGSIFISYRRADTGPWAGRLADSLQRLLPRVHIFRDIDGIPPGVTFDTYTAEAVGTCDAFIALIGPNWLTITDASGARRLSDPKDFTRFEIATALKRNIPVIPIVVGGGALPAAQDLPDDLKQLARRQQYPLTEAHWSDDCRKLATILRPLVKQRVVAPKVWSWVGIALVGILAIGYGLSDHFFPLNRDEPTQDDGVPVSSLMIPPPAAIRLDHSTFDFPSDGKINYPNRPGVYDEDCNQQGDRFPPTKVGRAENNVPFAKTALVETAEHQIIGSICFYQLYGIESSFVRRLFSYKSPFSTRAIIIKVSGAPNRKKADFDSQVKSEIRFDAKGAYVNMRKRVNAGMLQFDATLVDFEWGEIIRFDRHSFFVEDPIRVRVHVVATDPDQKQ
jgi:TIR domain